MEGIALFVSIVIIVFGVLQIILFFKLWGMTNNVKKIKRILNNKKEQDMEIGKTVIADGTKEGDLVVELKTERQMRVENITNDGKFECKASGMIVGVFKRNEIELFNKYWDKK